MELAHRDAPPRAPQFDSGDDDGDHDGGDGDDGGRDGDDGGGDVEAGDGDDNSCDEKQTMEVDDDD